MQPTGGPCALNASQRQNPASTHAWKLRSGPHGRLDVAHMRAAFSAGPVVPVESKPDRASPPFHGRLDMAHMRAAISAGPVVPVESKPDRASLPVHGNTPDGMLALSFV
eukprot:360342-Chlamydomonas_euryale.AAC.6